MKTKLIFLFLSISYMVFPQLKEIYYADPTIYAEDGLYYLSGTKNSSTAGFALLVSDDLKNWSVAKGTMAGGNVLSKDYNVYGTSGFWAPQFYKIGDVYYISYTASEQVAVAKSDKITGPFTQTLIEPVDASARNIDPFVFKDDDGKYYLYHVRFNNGNYIWVAEFDPVTNKIKSGTLRQCLSKTQTWENSPDDEYDGNIMEGPTVIKRNDIYYLFYSANHFKSIDYAVGYATAKSPLGPWTKYPNNPIISRNIVGENGSGHGDLFFDNEGKARYVYHVHNSSTTVETRKTRIIGLNFTYNSSLGYEQVYADLSSLIVPVYARDTIYVSPEGSGSKSGNSWTNSTTLSNAAMLVQAGQYSQLWLKSGIYNITSSINFDDLFIYGGFRGDEINLGNRNWNLNPTILDGKGSVSPLRNTTGTARTGGNAASIPCLLDGIIIQNGINSSGENGGGMLINNGAVIKNCIFRNNETQNNKNGAAIHCHYGNFLIENSLFINNTSTGNGGGIQAGDGVSVTLLNCTFANNKSNNPGGAVGTGTANSHVAFINSIAYNNLYGTSVYNSYGQNTNINGGGTIKSIHSAIESTSSKFGDADDINHMILSRTVAPGFVSPANVIGKGNTEAENDEIIGASYRLVAESRCIDYGLDDEVKEIEYDLAKTKRIQGTHVDLGAYEFSSDSDIPLKNPDKHTLKIVSTRGDTRIYGLQAENLLKVFNLQGVLIHTEKIKENEYFRISLPPGFYVLQAGGEVLKFRIKTI